MTRSRGHLPFRDSGIFYHGELQILKFSFQFFHGVSYVFSEIFQKTRLSFIQMRNLSSYFSRSRSTTWDQRYQDGWTKKQHEDFFLIYTRGFGPIFTSSNIFPLPIFQSSNPLFLRWCSISFLRSLIFSFSFGFWPVLKYSLSKVQFLHKLSI